MVRLARALKACRGRGCFERFLNIPQQSTLAWLAEPVTVKPSALKCREQMAYCP